ncbi:hypothetical protein [Chlorella virus XW01]|nr:hypothetical protein [Chlorella virus XW01]
MDTVNNITNYIDNFLTTFDNNKIFSSALGLFLVLYGSLAAPKLPQNVAILFKNDIFKFLVIFMIAFMASKDSSVAIIATIGLLISLQTLSYYETNVKILEVVEINAKSRINNLLNNFTNKNSNINFFPYIPLDTVSNVSVVEDNVNEK